MNSLAKQPSPTLFGSQSYRPCPQALTAPDKLQTLIENRSVHTLNHCELNLFETHRQSEHVSLTFGSLTFTAMLRGKKVMHLFNGKQQFEYVPGESVIVPENEEMVIDFPEATPENPTQCIALVIDSQKVKEILDILNEQHPKIEPHDRWTINAEQFHLKNTLAMAGTIDRLVLVSQEQHKAKDILANFALQELLIRLMQTQARNVILSNYDRYTTTHRFAAVVEYIKKNLTEPLTIEKLSAVAYMSQSHFFRSFKQEFGCSPVEFIIHERLNMAKTLLSQPQTTVTDACFKAGFNSVNYFCTLFKKHEGVSPRAFRQTVLTERQSWS
jgi:AraC family transcriptional regulator, arabinose operon regulatory protein